MRITLTITIDDSDRALQLIQSFYGDPAVSLTDIVIADFDPRPKTAAADPFARPFVDHRDQRSRDAEMAAEEARIEAMTRFPAKIADRPEDRAAVAANAERRARLAADRDARQARTSMTDQQRIERARDLDAAFHVACPTCQVKAERPCVKASGPYDRGFVHAARVSQGQTATDIDQIFNGGAR